MKAQKALRMVLALLVGAGLAFTGPTGAHAEDDFEVGPPFGYEVTQPNEAEIAAGSCTWIYTKDPAPTGAKARVCKTWVSNGYGGYEGYLWGTVYDTHPDGRSAYLRGKCDGTTRLLAQANGANDSPKVTGYYRYENCDWAGFRLGLINTSNREITYWSNWW